jgi:3-deoxy-D-manno-octulosonate 8-phosphate phosphatase (KDO 8-P phosphatase)
VTGGKLSAKALREKARAIKLLVLDVDGVLTDGGIILDGGDNEFKKFDVRDGHGIKLLARAGVEVAIITGRESKVVERRARELGINEVHQRSIRKTEAFEHLIGKLGLSESEAACMGDDVVDIPLFRRAGLSIAVADAHVEARRHAHMVTKAPGGRGAAREASEFILKAKGLWDDILRSYTEA